MHLRFAHSVSTKKEKKTWQHAADLPECFTLAHRPTEQRDPSLALRLDQAWDCLESGGMESYSKCQKCFGLLKLGLKWEYAYKKTLRIYQLNFINCMASKRCHFDLE